MTAARKQTKNDRAFRRKMDRFMSVHFAAWLASEGDQLLTLDAATWSVEGFRLCVGVSVRFSIGDIRRRRDVRRTFAVGKATKVPTVVVSSFLENTGVVYFNEAEADDVLGAEVIV